MIDWKEKYMRDVEGLNNEGDPIGGDSPSGLRAALEALQAENAKLKEVLRESCDYERSQLWEVGSSGGGCERAIDAESKYKELQENTKLLDEMLSKVIEERNNVEQSMCKLLQENAEQAKRIAILEQSEAIEVIDLRKENERMKATLTQFSEVLKKHHEQSHYDLVNTLGEILVSAQKGTE